ncbi:DUF1178 family protein [Azospirillum thermophilum]|uniref:DUF1178 domain-containing protein n=1 Tax=Azospirillum thermophilum TaxID=2202148 RepID=A0A2S2CNV9_9PROT|nr:DUF1178 family protein [Azospirillum thermophilum]AWK86172.1 DUF1178 domain-containing protein [Azospirillum thermophilum]
MILFELKCPSDHRFEAWFRNGAAYEEQAAAHQITCPICGDSTITKAPMAPRIAKGLGRKDKAEQPPAAGPVPAAPAAPVPVPVPVPAGEGQNRLASLPVPSNDAQRQAVAEVMRQLGELRRVVEQNCDYVGERFAEEARRIHYGETDPRGIYGEATAEEVEELRDEGVTFQRIPWLPRTDS